MTGQTVFPMSSGWNNAGVGATMRHATINGRGVSIPIDRSVELGAELVIPNGATGLVIFAHGSGSSRHSARNQLVAAELQSGGLATLLMDLLAAHEAAVDALTTELRFNIGLLARRVERAVSWALSEAETRDLPVGLFGASTGAAAALIAAARCRNDVRAVVSRGGRPDLAEDALPHVECPTLLIVGGDDDLVIDLNQRAISLMSAPVRLEIVPGAGHLFEEPGALQQVARLARDWFARNLRMPVD